MQRNSFFLTEIYNIKQYTNSCQDKSYKNLNKYETNLESYYKPSKKDNTLVFESKFESGNLCMAIKVLSAFIIDIRP